MFYQSTRNKHLKVSASKAILQGISDEGGLFVPQRFPHMDFFEFDALSRMDYADCAATVLGKYLTDFRWKELCRQIAAAYTEQKFGGPDPAPLRPLIDGVYVQELWHGPTCAFKDMALQMLPRLLTSSVQKQQTDQQLIILTATSGDTGKAALEGFKDVPDTSILVFYPKNGVSPMQQKQMTAQKGNNVGVYAVAGNFDDAQTAVKHLFTDPQVRSKLAQNGYLFSSANSINWGRLAPQIVYYIHACCRLIANGELREGEHVNVVVPTGNFGNILAAYYAKKMGAPIGKLICASNCNNILTDFINTGIYDKNRAFYTTMSPSMDILISSNLERLIFDLTGRDDEKIVRWMTELGQTGQYQADSAVKAGLAKHFVADYATEEQTSETIRNTFLQHGYLCDTHTAVAVSVYERYRERTGDHAPAVIVSTASPYKFPASVLGALKDQPQTGDEFALARELSERTNTPIPRPIRLLENAQPRFLQTCADSEMANAVYDFLGI